MNSYVYMACELYTCTHNNVHNTQSWYRLI